MNQDAGASPQPDSTTGRQTTHWEYYRLSVDGPNVETALHESTRHNGARLLTGGERDGAVISPAVVSGVSPDAALSQDELFGPAVAVTGVSGIDAAVELANSTNYGLGAGVFTGNVANAVRFAREVDAGNVHINWTPLWRADLMPYGGLKASGIGKEGPRSAVAEMTDTKTVILHGRPW